MGNKDNLLWLRRLHGNLYEKKLELSEKYRMWKYLTFPLRKKQIIIGTPLHSNIGDSAIVLAERCFIKKIFDDMSCIREITVHEYDKAESILKKKDMISHFYMGGGNMGDQWFSEEQFRRKSLVEFVKKNPIIFPQTIYYSRTEEGIKQEELSKQIYDDVRILMVARERVSYEKLKELYPKAKILLTPDIVLSTSMDDYGVESKLREYVMMCMRQDQERVMTDDLRGKIQSFLMQFDCPIVHTDMHSDCMITMENREECVRKKMQEFCKAKLVVTDRLHGMVFAAITGTPCVVFGNCNHKVKGTYEWISYLPYIKYVESYEEAVQAIPALINMDNNSFDNTKLNTKFDVLKDEIKKHLKYNI